MPWGGDYVSSADLKAFLRITDTDDDAQIALAVTAASRAADRFANRQFGLVAAPEARTYTARWSRSRCRYVVDIDDLMTVVGLVVETNGETVTDYTLQPSNAAQIGDPWTMLVFGDGVTVDLTRDGVEPTGRWGWTTVPTPVSTWRTSRD